MARKILKDKRDSRVYIKKIEYEDAYQVKNRGNFDDPWMHGYNYGNFTDPEIRFWYTSITGPRKRYFAVKRKEDDAFIGFLGLKNYNTFMGTAKLGIVFDANFVSQGYGYEAMEILLDYYFDDLGFNELYLDVNDFNLRAFRLYKKLGFVVEDHCLQVFENQKIIPDDTYFEIHNGMIYTKITQMKIRKDDR
ncbi:MAG: GNAT family N-acetyltransferase [Anaerococcus sp.]|jgi:diamine N-acetyltransferase|nr:GNAT family N-acetyltransferase [Peptoniphilaceae bacterium]MDY3055780.1 GNAT family N-acetyltransferase [Anaerococcus sp.]